MRNNQVIEGSFWLLAKLSPETLTTIFSLQRQLIELIAETKATEFNLFKRYGETEETLPELEQIQNCLERLRNPYSRLHTLTLRISEYYPVAPSAILELLDETIEQAKVSADAVAASLSETKRNWRL
jgi:hypothetical protein